MQENTEVPTMCLVSLICKIPLMHLLLTVILLIHMCSLRVKMWTHMSPNGKICCISLYKQAKRAYLDRLKVKNFYVQVSDYTIIAASLIPFLPSIFFFHLLSLVTTVDLLTLLKYSRKPQACHFGHNLNLFSHLGRKCVNTLSVSIVSSLKKFLLQQICNMFRRKNIFFYESWLF